MRSYSIFTAVGLAALLTGSALGSPVNASLPLLGKRTQQLAIDKDFPDPTLEQAWDGSWYAFATSGNGKNIQVAHAPAREGPWTWLDQDALPNSGSWTTGANNWAPDVKRMPPASRNLYIMTYSGQLASNPAHHCVGIATASNPAGPYTPQGGPVICPDIASTGGAIDSALFYDERNNKRYLVYKEDGNSVGNGGTCNNGIAPIHGTPIMLQEMNVNDWVTPVGSPVKIFDRIDSDGPLVEAPVIINGASGDYLLFFSTHCFTDPAYDVQYASAPSITGPYTRRGHLLGTGDFGLTAPGGANPSPGGEVLLFHANCNAGRCLHSIDMTNSGGIVTLKA